MMVGEEETPLNDLQGLLGAIEVVNGLVSRYKENTAKVQELHTSLLGVPWGQARYEEINKQLTDLDQDNRQIIKDVRAAIKNASQLTVDDETTKAEKLSSAEQWAREAAAAYHAEQVRYRDKAKARLVKAVQITGAELTAEQIEERLEAGAAFAPPPPSLEDAGRLLDEVEGRRREFEKLEAGIAELAGLFDEVSLLVADQADKLDNVESNVGSAGESVAKAVRRLKTSRSLRDKVCTRRFVACFVGSFVVCLLIIVIAALSTSKGGNGGNGGGSSSTADPDFDQEGSGLVLPPCEGPADTNCSMED